ncbi:MAG: polysaccharide deacetylase family protein, partial [Cyclobacteriaceae bacterium]
MQFHRLPGLISGLFSDLVWRIENSKERCVYLTFDDGPMPGPTDFVLEQLSGFSAKATFFCIGDNICKHPEVYQKILSEGHRIGNHTFRHLNGWSVRASQYFTDILECETAIGSANSVLLFRPPFGKLHPSYRQILPHMKIVMWDILSCDYDHTLNPQKGLSEIKRLTRPGSIVVFHDSLKAEKNLRNMLPEYLK